MYPCRPPVRVSQKDTWNIYVATRITTFHIWRFEICIVWMVQQVHDGPLDCISNPFSGWKSRCIQLFRGIKQRRVPGFWKRIAVVSGGTYSFVHLTYLLNLSLTLVVFIQRLQEVRARSWVHWSKIWEEEEEWRKTKTEAKIPGMYQNSYVLLYCWCSLYVIILCIIYSAVHQTTS